MKWCNVNGDNVESIYLIFYKALNRLQNDNRSFRQCLKIITKTIGSIKIVI